MAIFFNESIKLWTKAVLMTSILSKKVGEGGGLIRRLGRNEEKLQAARKGDVASSWLRY
jgi:hypothetical protein